MLKAPPMTPEMFEAFALRPENRDRRLECVDGMVIEMLSSSKSSRIAAYALGRLSIYLDDHPLGWLTGADGGYLILGRHYIPDVAYTSFARQPQAPDVAYNPLAPDLVIEVVSPTDDRDHLRRKVADYVAAGCRVWLVDAAQEHVEVYAPGQPVQVLGMAAALDGGDLLPGFTLKVASLLQA